MRCLNITIKNREKWLSTLNNLETKNPSKPLNMINSNKQQTLNYRLMTYIMFARVPTLPEPWSVV